MIINRSLSCLKRAVLLLLLQQLGRLPQQWSDVKPRGILVSNQHGERELFVIKVPQHVVEQRLVVLTELIR